MKHKKVMINESIKVMYPYDAWTLPQLIEKLQAELSELTVEQQFTARFKLDMESKYNDPSPILRLQYQREKTADENKVRLSIE